MAAPEHGVPDMQIMRAIPVSHFKKHVYGILNYQTVLHASATSPVLF
jgi:hypothetical protein